MSDNNHGGKRKGAGRPSGTPNPNAGRKKSTETLRLGQEFVAEVGEGSKVVLPPMPFVVTKMEDGVVHLECEEYSIALYIG